jgi:hypothetical protein
MAIEELLKSPRSKEALEWLRGGLPGSRTLGELPDTGESISLVTELYALGATKVTAVEIDIYDTGEENTGKIIISLPKEKAKRANLFEWSSERAEEMGFDPDRDVGQKHIFVMLD